MTVTDFNLRHQNNKKTDRKPLSLSLLIGVLAVLTIDGLVMIAPTISTATHSVLGTQQSRMFQCATTDTEHERLACYDRIGNETLQPPARGANAPLGLGVKDIFVR
jgi:hypothetical protein